MSKKKLKRKLDIRIFYDQLMFTIYIIYIIEGVISKMKKKKKQIYSDVYDMAERETDENFYFIVGYTSNGFPFGITWEEAIEEGLVEDINEIELEDMPF